ncbi:hypothetical protein RSAG8_09905, partial [Rhizoctonia solani AG-8 WAC10335]
MSSTITSTWLVPSSPTGSTSSFTNTWGIATPEDTEPLNWAAWAVTDPAWDLDWALDIYVLGGHVDAFDYWAWNKGANPNNWLWELIPDIDQKNQWATIGRDRDVTTHVRDVSDSVGEVCHASNML